MAITNNARLIRLASTRWISTGKSPAGSAVGRRRSRHGRRRHREARRRPHHEQAHRRREVRRHHGQLRHRMSKAFYEWIKACFDHKHSRNDGAIITADYDYKEVTRLNFFNALITEVGFPALDAASKDAAKMTHQVRARVHPHRRRNGGGHGCKLALGKGEQKKWLPANFRLASTGSTTLARASTRSRRSPSSRRSSRIRSASTATTRRSRRASSIPNLVVTLRRVARRRRSTSGTRTSSSTATTIRTRRRAARSSSSRRISRRRPLHAHLLAPRHLQAQPEKVEAGSENIRRVKAEMYCEQITFKYRLGRGLRVNAVSTTAAGIRQSRSPQRTKRWPFRPSIRSRSRRVRRLRRQPAPPGRHAPGDGEGRDHPAAGLSGAVEPRVSGHHPAQPGDHQARRHQVSSTPTSSRICSRRIWRICRSSTGGSTKRARPRSTPSAPPARRSSMSIFSRR